MSQHSKQQASRYRRLDRIGRSASIWMLVSCLAAAATPSVAKEAGGQSPALAALAELARGAGIDLALVGPADRLGELIGTRAESRASALEALRGGSTDRIEIYDPEGELTRMVMVVPGGAGSRTLVRASRPLDSSRDITYQEALRTARDRSASASDRQRAIAALARSGRHEAVQVLREVAEENGGLTRAALAALGGFADTPAAEAAEQAIAGMPEEVGDATDRARAEAAYNVGALLQAYQDAPNTLERINMIYATSTSAGGQALTDFFLQGPFKDKSSTARLVAANQAIRLMDKVDANAALRDLARNDRSSKVREAAGQALALREAGGRQEKPLARKLTDDERLRLLTPGGNAGDQATGGCAGGRCADDSPVEN